MNKKLLVFILVVLFVFTNVSAQTNTGYELALTAFSASASHIQHYESFTVTITPRNVGLIAFPGGEVGAALVDNNGRIAAVVGTRNRGALNAGSLSGALEFNCIVPHTVNPGRYQLRAVIRPTGGEWRLTTLALPNIPNSIDFEVRVNPNIVVAPLLQIKWSHHPPFNSMLPGGSASIFPGCDVIAAAKIMKFYRHPMRTNWKSEPYTMRTSRLNVPSVNLNAVFNWDDMLNSYHSDGSDSNDRQRNAVAQLILHIGVLRKKDFTTGYTGDGAAGYPQLLTTIYGFDKSIQYLSRGNYSDADWENIIRSQLDAGMPVFYSGNNETNTTPHTFIIDGYDNQGRFHINMGWGGLHDGWYFLNAINPGNSDFNFYQNIYINIKPDEGSIGSNEFMLSAFTASSASVSQNEVLTVTPVLNSQGFFPGGQAGIALVGNNNNITAVIGSRNMGSNWQPGSRAALVINCSVPGTVNPGQYRLMAVTRIEGGEWKIVTASDREARVPNSIPFSVTKGAANSGGYVLAFASINADNGIVSASRGAQFNVNYNIRNPGTESFEGSLRAVLIDNAGNETVIGTRASTSFDAGSGRTSFVSCTIPNTIAHGNYQLKIAVRPTDGEWRIITMSFDNAPNSISFTVR